MLDDGTLGTKDQERCMPDKFPPPAPALSADNIRENARAKAVRASYEFWSTGNVALLEQAFAETFADHPRVRVRAATNVRPSRRLDAPKKESK
jgi:hypothetical protein